MRGTDLGIMGIILLGCLALVLAFFTILISKDAEVIKSALVIAAIAGSSVSLLGGFIGGYHVGKNDAISKPTTPEVS